MNSKFKCTNCKKYFKSDIKQKNTLSKFCSNECKFEYFKSLKNKQKQQTTLKKVKHNKKVKVKKRRKSLAKLKKDLWGVFSKYIRLRDAIKTTGTTYKVRCITCDQLKDIKKVDAGHFLSRRYTEILFNEFNVHAQCKKCNMPPDPGEQYLYSKKIIELYGQDKLDELLLLKNKVKSFTRGELESSIDEYKQKILSITDEWGDPWDNK